MSAITLACQPTEKHSTMTVTPEMIADAAAAAVQARQHAYAPYSDFPMGAAVMTEDGSIVPGVLIENVSLGLAMCAERVALFTSVTQQKRPAVLALCSRRTDDNFTFPCGACLQVALELSDQDLTVVAIDPDGAQTHTTLGDLLPKGPKRHTPGDSD